MHKLIMTFFLLMLGCISSAWAGFQVYTGNLIIEDKTTGIRYGYYDEPKSQCVRSRYGEVGSDWPCKRVEDYIPRETYRTRKYIITEMTPSSNLAYERAMQRMRSKN